MDRFDWLDTATSRIRFGPDRARVRQELEDHILDRIEAARARGSSSRQAEQAALEAMGDPAPLAEELGALHRPWLGYLWRASRWVLAVLAVLAVIGGIREIHGMLTAPANTAALPGLPAEIEMRESDTGTYIDRLLESWTIEGSVSLGGYRFTVPVAYLQETICADAEEIAPVYTLVLCLRSSTWRYWEPISAGQSMILSNEAVDSSGSRYSRWGQEDFSPETRRDYFCDTYEESPLSTWFVISLGLPDSRTPDWVDIPIGYGSASLRVNLKEGVVAP